MKSHLFSHLLLVIFLAGLGVAGIWRIQGHLEVSRQVQQRLEYAMADAEILQKQYLALLQAQAAWQQAVVTGERADWRAFGSIYQRWRNLARHQIRAESVLREQVVLHQLQLLVEAEQRRLAVSPDELLQPPPRLLDMASLWADLNGAVQREIVRQSNLLLDQRGRLVLEATVIFVACIVVLILYMYAVNAYLGRPVMELAAAARAVRRGDLTARVTPRGDGPVRHLANDLNRMVDLLVASLAEEERVVQELQLKARQLEDANRHKSQFLANISHELKTPLNAIIGFADILASGHHGELNDKQRDYIARVGQAGGHLLAMISDLIDLAKMDVGAMRLAPTCFPVAPLIEEVTNMLAPQLEEKAHRLEIKVDAPRPVVLDRQRLQQILLNLLSNAIKFTGAEGHLTVRASQTETELILCVEDDGIGIDKEAQAAIFEQFVQVDSRLQRQHEGTGIGLALCRRLAEMMGGTIEVDSQPGEGSTFTLRLPIGSEPEVAVE